ncbi:3-hydroxyacyl-CoA dehydrogenase NAD-binding domain-containing protein [Streptomyces canus]|uniref:3-hydroxyacyl-CoA dehydrogenase NAD-binding domain-containing protein n=1 Tax=Streptomyces canus TaxID=58343 RepID=UPI0036A9CED4
MIEALTYFGSVGKGSIGRLRSRPLPRLGVVGCGLVGSGSAQVATLRGLDVTVAESAPELASACRERVTASLALPSFTNDRADRQVAIEAVAENREVKLDICRHRKQPRSERVSR